jgi:hypothetical protein
MVYVRFSSIYEGLWPVGFPNWKNLAIDLNFFIFAVRLTFLAHFKHFSECLYQPNTILQR